MARRLPIGGSATESIRVENGLIIREDTAATGQIHVMKLNQLSFVLLNREAGANDLVTLVGPGSGFELRDMQMADADALELVNFLASAPGFAANGVHTTLED